MTKYVVSIGNLDTGFKFIGPFKGGLDVKLWTDLNVAKKTQSYEVWELHDPDKYTKEGPHTAA